MPTSHAVVYEPLSHEVIENPYPTYERLRNEDPVYWHSGMESWVITRFDDCKRVMEDHQTFASDFRFAGEHRTSEQLSLQVIDPPEHTIVRDFLIDLLRRVNVQAWAERSAAGVEARLLESEGRPLDMITEVLDPVTIESMFDLFGVPFASDLDRFRSAARDLILSMDAGLAPERGQPGQDARKYLSSILIPHLENPPEHGVLSQVRMEVDGTTYATLLNSLRAVFVAGYTSSSSMLGSMLHQWISRGLIDQYRETAISTAMVAELQRLDAPVQAESRAAVSDVTMRGKKIRRGDILVILVGSANRDEREFETPDDFDPSRQRGQSIAFGRGIHACLGAQFATRLGTEVLNTVQKFDLQPVEPPVQRPTATLRGLDHLIISANSK